MAGVFGAASTTDEVLRDVSLNGRRILVTGVSAGIGVENRSQSGRTRRPGGRCRTQPGQGQGGD